MKPRDAVVLSIISIRNCVVIIPVLYLCLATKKIVLGSSLYVFTLTKASITYHVLKMF